MPQLNDDAKTSDSDWKGLYRVGGMAALIAALVFRRNLDVEISLFSAQKYPDTIIGWFTLLQDNKLLGLAFLNLFDIVNYALVGLIFLALCVALRRVSKSFIALAATISLLGIAVYFASNQAFSMLSLSNQYAAATTDTQRAMLEVAGQAVLAIHSNATYAGAGIYMSFLLVSMAGLIISVVMLRSNIFGRVTAFMGILANVFGLGYYVALAFAPATVFLPISVSAIFLLIWYILTGLRLF